MYVYTKCCALIMPSPTEDLSQLKRREGVYVCVYEVVTGYPTTVVTYHHRVAFPQSVWFSRHLRKDKHNAVVS